MTEKNPMLAALLKALRIGQENPSTNDSKQPNIDKPRPETQLLTTFPGEAKKDNEATELAEKKERLTADLNLAYSVALEKLKQIVSGQTLRETLAEIVQTFNTVCDNTIERVKTISEVEAEQYRGTTENRIRMYREIRESAAAKKREVERLATEANQAQSTRKKQEIVSQPAIKEVPKAEAGPGFAAIQKEIIDILNQPHTREGARAVEHMTPEERTRTNTLDQNTTGEMGLSIIVAINQLAIFFDSAADSRITGNDRIKIAQSMVEVLQKMKDMRTRKDIVRLLLTRIEPSLIKIEKNHPMQERLVVGNLIRLAKDLK